MRKFLSGVLIGFVLTVLGLLLIVFIVGRIVSSRQPVVAGNSVLVLSLEGDLPETSSVDVPIPFIQSQTMPSIRDTWAALHQAATDNRIKAVVLQPRSLSLGWARLQELREELSDFKKSGKPLYALLRGAGSREYYLASVADRIFLSPDDLLDVKGFRVETTYFKGALDKLGVGVQVDHIGRYKDAGDPFTRTDPSPESREALNGVLDQLYGDFCSSVAAGRHKSVDAVRAAIDEGPFLAQQALKSGLVDQLGYEDQVYAELKRKTSSKDLNKVSLPDFARGLTTSGDKIAYVVGQGDIVRGSQNGGYNSSQVLSVAEMTRSIRQVRNDSSIKGVILRIDSPGGDAVASDEILHELKLLSLAKPVVISMSDLAASGGYFIAMTGDAIISYPNTITGSIGVLYVRPNFHDLYGKLGLQDSILTRGKLADLDSATEPLSDAARQKLHDAIQGTYNSFVSKVAAARKRSFQQIDSVAQGRVWMGTQARQNGLVDELGGLDLAVSMIRNKAHLSPQGATNLVPYPPKRSLLELLAESSSAKDLARGSAATEIRNLLPQLPTPSILNGGLLRIIPYRLTVQ